MEKPDPLQTDADGHFAFLRSRRHFFLTPPPFQGLPDSLRQQNPTPLAGRDLSREILPPRVLHCRLPDAFFWSSHPSIARHVARLATSRQVGPVCRRLLSRWRFLRIYLHPVT